MSKIDELPHVEITSRAEWRAWLAANHSQSEGIWLVTYKKQSGDRYLAWPDIVQEALCFGWIDGRMRRADEDRVKRHLSPRKSGSNWSAVNKRHVAELQQMGRMTLAGQGQIDAAKADGSWTFLDDIDALIEPDDLVAALDASPAARATWDATKPSARKQALYHVKTAKRPDTRMQRIEQIVERTARGEPPV